MQEVFEFIFRELENERPVVSAVIVSSSGSTPRSTGSRMAISKDGLNIGSVGGGVGEALVQKEGQKVHQARQSSILSLDLTGKQAADYGMICGGKQEILVEYIEPVPENKALFSRLMANLEKGVISCLCTAFVQKSGKVEIIARTLDPAAFPAVLPSALTEEAEKRAQKSRMPFALRRDEYSLLVEPLRSTGKVIIAGAGHVGQATAHLAAYVGFNTLVLDDRQDFLNREKLPLSVKLHFIENFDNCLQDLEIKSDCFIVILTRGHQYDKTVLGQALKTPAHYIGMIGSRKKRQAIYKALQKEGFSQEDLDRVHCPIGLPIGGDTPQELGLSIVGELIQSRAKL